MPTLRYKRGRERAINVCLDHDHDRRVIVENNNDPSLSLARTHTQSSALIDGKYVVNGTIRAIHSTSARHVPTAPVCARGLCDGMWNVCIRTTTTKGKNVRAAA